MKAMNGWRFASENCRNIQNRFPDIHPGNDVKNGRRITGMGYPLVCESPGIRKANG